MPRSRAGGLLLLLLALAVAGCAEQSPAASGDDSETPSASSPATPTSKAAIPKPKPDCSKIWVVGADLPASYTGCSANDGSLVKPKGIPCESGQLLVRHGSHYYAVPGHRVNRTAQPLRTDPDFAQVLARCTG